MARPVIGPPRGLLRAPAAEGAIEHERRAPSPRLAPFVEHHWTVVWRGVDVPVVREVLPHPSVHIAFERGRSGIAGVPEGRFVRTLEGEGWVLGVKMRPGGFRPFVDHSIARLKNRVVPIDAVFGEGTTERTLERMRAATSFAARVEIVEALLEARLPEVDPRAVLAADIVRRVLEDASLQRVADVAAAFGLSPRALQRLFTEYVGVSPKWVILRYRLHEALERMHAGQKVDHAALAAELGFTDQAHFIRAFKALVGRPPAAYERSTTRDEAKR